jgi:arsenate reductase
MAEVLFVCVHNAGRSQMAQAFFNHCVSLRNLPFHADSAGTAPGPQVNPVAVQAMDEVGIEMSRQAPKLLTPTMAGEAGRIITMGCGVETDMCPAGTYISDDWGLPDPQGKGLEAVREVRDAIRERVEALISDLGANA